MIARLTNWAGNVTFRASELHRPPSVDELCQIGRAHV